MSSLGLHPLVAERRHSSVTRYAKRSVACRDSPRHQPLRARGTPLPHLRRLPHHIVRHTSDCANGAARKTAEERFNMLARGWLAYPVTPMHTHLPPKSGCINVIPVCARGALLLVTPSARRDSGGRMGHRRDTISMRFGDALLRRPRKRSRLQLTPDRVGGTRTDAYAPRSAAAERSIAKCRKLGRR